ncbi:hypothetical protein Tco_1244246 [Tanacetum coccineum]
MTHPHPYRRFVPQAVLTKSGKINTAGASVNTAVRPVKTAGSKPTVNHPRQYQMLIKRDIHKVKDTTARDRAVVSKNKEKRVNAVKAGWSRLPPFQYQPTRSGKVDRNACNLREK